MYIKNGIKKTLAEVRTENPNISIPAGADLTLLGYETFIETPKPTYNLMAQRVEEGTPLNNTQVWNIVDLPLDEVKARMFDMFFAYADEKENALEVTTSVGITVKANAVALQAFTLGAKRGATIVRDKGYMKHTVSVPQMNTILSEIEDNAIAFFELKGNKFDEIISLTTVSACITYIQEPYDYVVTQNDVDNDTGGTLVLGQTITKYKNNIKEW